MVLFQEELLDLLVFTGSLFVCPNVYVCISVLAWVLVHSSLATYAHFLSCPHDPLFFLWILSQLYKVALSHVAEPTTPTEWCLYSTADGDMSVSEITLFYINISQLHMQKIKYHISIAGKFAMKTLANKLDRRTAAHRTVTKTLPRPHNCYFSCWKVIFHCQCSYVTWLFIKLINSWLIFLRLMFDCYSFALIRGPDSIFQWITL